MSSDRYVRAKDFPCFIGSGSNLALLLDDTCKVVRTEYWLRSLKRSPCGQWSRIGVSQDIEVVIRDSALLKILSWNRCYDTVIACIGVSPLIEAAGLNKYTAYALSESMKKDSHVHQRFLEEQGINANVSLVLGAFHEIPSNLSVKSEMHVPLSVALGADAGKIAIIRFGKTTLSIVPLYPTGRPRWEHEVGLSYPTYTEVSSMIGASICTQSEYYSALWKNLWPVLLFAQGIVCEDGFFCSLNEDNYPVQQLNSVGTVAFSASDIDSHINGTLSSSNF